MSNDSQSPGRIDTGRANLRTVSTSSRQLSLPPSVYLPVIKELFVSKRNIQNCWTQI